MGVHRMSDEGYCDCPEPVTLPEDPEAFCWRCLRPIEDDEE
jgi:hypothetical protein